MPINTPGYTIRLEIGRNHLSCEISKLILNWIEKILNMTDNRYPKKCLMRLRKMEKMKKEDKILRKFNWARQVRECFVELGEEKEWENLTLISLQKNKKNWIERYIAKCRFIDLQKAQKSSSLLLYSQMVSGLSEGPQKYLTSLSISFRQSKTIAQLRLINKF